MPQNRLFSMQVLVSSSIQKEYNSNELSSPKTKLPSSHHDRSSIIPVQLVPSQPFSILIKHLNNSPLNPSHAYSCVLSLNGETIGGRLFSEMKKSGLRIDGKSVGGGMIVPLEFTERVGLGFISLAIKKRRNVRLDEKIVRPGKDNVFEREKIAAKSLGAVKATCGTIRYLSDPHNDTSENCTLTIAYQTRRFLATNRLIKELSEEEIELNLPFGVIKRRVEVVDLTLDDDDNVSVAKEEIDGVIVID